MSFCFSDQWLKKGSLPSHHLPELCKGEDFLEGLRGLNPIERLLREETKKNGFQHAAKGGAVSERPVTLHTTLKTC